MNVENTGKEQHEWNFKCLERLDKLDQDRATFKHKVELSLKTTEELYCTKTTHTNTTEELYKYINNQLLSYSKKDKCNADFVEVKKFSDLYTNNEATVKHSLKETKHLLDHFGIAIREMCRQDDADKIQKQVDTLPTKDYLHQFIFRAIEPFNIF